jgi:anti-sigma factor RsiW
VSAHEGERLSAWLDGELSADDAAAVEAHVATCGECAATAAQMRTAGERLRDSPVVAPPGYFDTFAARVRARVEAEPRRRPRQIPAWTWAAAAALLLAVVTPLTVRSRVGAPPAAAPAAPDRSPVPRGEVPSPASGLEPERQQASAVVPRAAGSASTGDLALDKGAAAMERARTNAPAVLARPAVAPDESAVAEGTANQVVASGAGVESSVPGGVVGGVVGGVPEHAAAPAALAKAAPAAGGQAGTAGAPFGALSAQSRTSAAAPARRESAPAGAAADALAVEEKSDRGAAASSFADLARSTPAESTARTAADWRRLRDEWRAFAVSFPSDPRADEARLRAVEAAFELWRATGAPDDRRGFEQDAAAYLAREDAVHKDRVLSLVRRAEARPR